MFEEAIRKAETLVEALGYIRKFRHHLVVIKLGGSVMEHEAALQSMLQDIVFMETVGVRPMVVHGGGKAITKAMTEAGIEARFAAGRRYTDDRTLEIVADTLTNQINADMVRGIEKLGGWAMGMHHRSTNCLFGQKIELVEHGVPIDLGRVGTINRVDVDRLRQLSRAGIIPVLPSLAMDANGELLNVNADTAAAAVASALKADKLVFVSDTPGILRDQNDEQSLIRSLSAGECQGLMANGVIDGGMIPKVEACLDSLRGGVGKTHMIDGRVRHSLLLEIYTESGIGTEVVLDR